jgi:hypothetical protein
MNIKETINQLLDQEKSAKNLKTDEALAQSLGVTAMTLTRWRKGESLGKAANVFLPMLAKQGATNARLN